MKNIEQDDENNIDLDTRIAMMFKEKSFGAAPPFLQLDDSESETEKENATTDAGDHLPIEKIKTEINTENSNENSLHTINEATSSDSTRMTPNSGGQTKIKGEKKKCIEDGASDISSDDEILESCVPPKTASVDVKLEDDKMSLSSLSSTEEKVNLKSRVSGVILQKNPDPQAADYYYPPNTNPYYYPNNENLAYDPYNSQYMSSHGYMQPYMPGFPALIPGGYVQSEYPINKDELVTSVPEPKKDPTEQIVSAVIERVKMELKQILKKDFNKRMIESIAYKKYDSWWDEKALAKNKPSTIVM